MLHVHTVFILRNAQAYVRIITVIIVSDILDIRRGVCCPGPTLEVKSPLRCLYSLRVNIAFVEYLRFRVEKK